MDKGLEALKFIVQKNLSEIASERRAEDWANLCKEVAPLQQQLLEITELSMPQSHIQLLEAGFCISYSNNHPSVLVSLGTRIPVIYPYDPAAFKSAMRLQQIYERFNIPSKVRRAYM